MRCFLLLISSVGTLLVLLFVFLRNDCKWFFFKIGLKKYNKYLFAIDIPGRSCLHQEAVEKMNGFIGSIEVLIDIHCFHLVSINAVEKFLRISLIVCSTRRGGVYDGEFGLTAAC